jgi:hypothetical protein
MNTVQRTDEQGYNGWANHATWAIHLHLTNDQGLDSWAREIVTDAYRSELDSAESIADADSDGSWARRVARMAAADALADWFSEQMYDRLDDGADWRSLLILDLLPKGSDVDWREIVVALLDDEDGAL